jgi:hypothetical protein
MGLPLVRQVVGEEPIHDGAMLIPAGIVAVAIIGIEPLIRGTNPVEQSVTGLRWTDVVLEPDVHDDRAGNPVGEVDAVVIGERLLDGQAAFGRVAQVVVDLFIRIRMRKRLSEKG